VKLLIISPQGQESYIIEWIEAHTLQGNIIIQSGHAPLIVTLVADKNLTFLLKTGDTKMIHLDRPGFLEINRTMVTALINKSNE
jgi:F0F1-type ATP synthase epsilon subunit